MIHLNHLFTIRHVSKDVVTISFWYSLNLCSSYWWLWITHQYYSICCCQLAVVLAIGRDSIKFDWRLSHCLARVEWCEIKYVIILVFCGPPCACSVSYCLRWCLLHSTYNKQSLSCGVRWNTMPHIPAVCLKSQPKSQRDLNYRVNDIHSFAKIDHC